MSEVTKRPVTRELCVPFEENDERRTELVETIIDAQKRIVRQSLVVQREKAILKGYEEDLHSAVSELSLGISRIIPCTEKIIWNDNQVIVTRDDTGEVIVEREIREEDRQMQVNDIDEQNEGDGESMSQDDAEEVMSDDEIEDAEENYAEEDSTEGTIEE